MWLSLAWLGLASRPVPCRALLCFALGMADPGLHTATAMRCDSNRIFVPAFGFEFMRLVHGLVCVMFVLWCWHLDFYIYFVSDVEHTIQNDTTENTHHPHIVDNASSMMLMSARSDRPHGQIRMLSRRVDFVKHVWVLEMR